MKVYIPEESECQEVTEGLVPAQLSKRFNRLLVPKNPTGPTFNFYVRRECDGYYYFMDSCEGTESLLGLLVFLSFLFSGILFATLSIIAWRDPSFFNINPLPGSGNESHFLLAMVYMLLAIFLALGIWLYKLSKIKVRSVVIFNREAGTVAFPEIERQAGITVPFEEVDYGVRFTSPASNSITHLAYLRTRVCRPGQPPRKDQVIVNGRTEDEYIQEWNLICQFMDKTRPIPACLHQAIAANQNSGHDMWEKAPYPEHRIFDPPLHEREFAPEIEADLEELAEALQAEGHSEAYARQFIEDWKNKVREERRQRRAALGIE